MTKEEFIEEHIKHCKANRCKKYDNKKLSYSWLHTLAYSRRKCAKNCRKKYLKTQKYRDEEGISIKQ